MRGDHILCLMVWSAACIDNLLVILCMLWVMLMEMLTSSDARVGEHLQCNGRTDRKS